MLKSLVMIALCLFSFTASYLLTGLIRRYALNHSLLDVPNARSSHVVATPRGGGLAVVIVFLSIMGGLSLLDSSIPLKPVMNLILSGASVAAIGFWDDRQSIPARWRFMVHFAAAAWGLYWLGGLPPIIFFGHIVDLGWAGQVLGLLYLVWLLNLYNFMDGIDGKIFCRAIAMKKFKHAKPDVNNADTAAQQYKRPAIDAVFFFHCNCLGSKIKSSILFTTDKTHVHR